TAIKNGIMTPFYWNMKTQPSGMYDHVLEVLRCDVRISDVYCRDQRKKGGKGYLCYFLFLIHTDVNEEI
ncbi:unnamed protein product, partial [Bubo scandiacus]